MHFLGKYKKRTVLYLIDLSILALSYLFAFATSFIGDSVNDRTSEIPRYLISFLIFAICITAAKLAIRVYTNVWRYVSSRAYLEMVFSDAVGGVVALIVTLIFKKAAYLGLWHSIAIITTYTLVTLLSRFLYQEKHKISSTDKVRREGEKKNVAIVGAGTIGTLLSTELLCYQGSQYRPLFFIDSDDRKIGNKIDGLPVYPENDETKERIKSCGISELIIAIPTMTPERAQYMFDYYGDLGCKIKVYDFPSGNGGESGKRVIREFKIEDLLFRNAIKLINDETRDFYRDRVVLVTGGGGSIGSELCRQIAACMPKKLIIFDIYENNAYDIQQELVRRYGESLDLAVEIGSVRERARLDALFNYYRPEIVFHAAAHKHVPLMEHSNAEAIKNNVFGTYNTADMAERYGTKKFILISTDKAVNPTNVMGASKRMCEMVIRCRRDSKTSFSAVRFGNVLGSNGSVIPLFNRQIAQGGPITITDKRIIRYFMTIPEASGLVMTAGAMAERGELFVLDMGKPVKIYDLAVNMIKFSGLTPGVDIKIKEIGLRPGEKLYEELLVKKDNMQRTENNLIFIESEEPLLRDEVEDKLEILRDAVKENEGLIASEKITLAMKAVVPTFHTPEEINRHAGDAEEMKTVATV